MASPSDYLQGMYDQAKKQFFALNPSSQYSAPNISQNDYDSALEPVARGAANIGLGVGGFASASPLLTAGGIVGAIADQFLKSPIPEGTIASPAGGENGEAGMNSLPISTLIKMAQQDTERQLAGPTIHDVINARKNLFHATTEERQGNIQNSGIIIPGGTYSGVSTSRVPQIGSIDPDIRFVIDPDKAPITDPIAESSWTKTYKIGPKPGFWGVMNKAKSEDLEQMKDELHEQGFHNIADNIKTPDSPGAFNLIYTPTFKKIQDSIGNTTQMSPDFEFEQRTRNRTPIDLNSMVKEVLTRNDPIDAWKTSMDSNNPLPVRAIAKKLLPLYNVIKNKELSQQVTGQGQ